MNKEFSAYVFAVIFYIHEYNHNYRHCSFVSGHLFLHCMFSDSIFQLSGHAQIQEARVAKAKGRCDLLSLQEYKTQSCSLVFYYGKRNHCAARETIKYRIDLV